MKTVDLKSPAVDKNGNLVSFQVDGVLFLASSFLYDTFSGQKREIERLREALDHIADGHWKDSDAIFIRKYARMIVNQQKERT